ncbi:MAG: helix-turn-helix domain-containing protein [Pseudomonadota bacterium]
MTNLAQIEPLLHTRDAAAMLGVSQAWLERQRWKGEEPAFVRVGGLNGRAVRYRKSDLEAYIESHTIHPNRSDDR